MFIRKKHVAPKATYREVWSKGNFATKLSFFIMGSNALEKDLHFYFQKLFSSFGSSLVVFLH